jgi:hypothetical protein
LSQNISFFDPSLTFAKQEMVKLQGDDGHCRVMTPGLRNSRQTTQIHTAKYARVVLKQSSFSATKPIQPR